MMKFVGVVRGMKSISEKDTQDIHYHFKPELRKSENSSKSNEAET